MFSLERKALRSWAWMDSQSVKCSGGDLIEESGCRLECLWSPFSDVTENRLRWGRDKQYKPGDDGAQGSRIRLKDSSSTLSSYVTGTKVLTLSGAQSQYKRGKMR